MQKKIFLMQISIISLITTNLTITSCENLNCNNISQNLWQYRTFLPDSFQEITLVKHPVQKEAIKSTNSKCDHFWKSNLTVQTEYMQSFGKSSQYLGALPFWSGTNTMTIGTNDGKSDVDAYQFGMGNVTEQGSITFLPSLRFIGTDLGGYFVHNPNRHGFYIKLHAPIGAVTVTNKLCEQEAKLDESVDENFALYPSPASRYKSLSEAFHGGTVTPEAIIATNVHKPIALDYGKIALCKKTKIRLGDLQSILGYNLIIKDDNFFNAGLKISYPTGNIPEAKYILEPIVGRAGHWGVGLELTGHYQFKRNNKDSHEINIWAQAEALHLFSGRTPNYRSFDLKQNGPGSKYLLLQFYFPGNPTVDNPTGRVPSFITHAIHLTTLPVHSTFDVEGSAALLIELVKKSWNCGLGFEVWGRTKEKLRLDITSAFENKIFNFNDFAVLGRQISEDVEPFPALELYLCEPLAKINKSEDRMLTKTYTDKIKDARIATNRIPAEIDNALDICAAATKAAITGKIFAEFGYTFNKVCFDPNVSIFGSVEFSGIKHKTLNLWSIGLQGTIRL